MTGETSNQASRQRSRQVIDGLGLPFNSRLPAIEGAQYARSKDDVCKRALALQAVVAVSYGFPASDAHAWLISEGLVPSLTRDERVFLQGGRGEASLFQLQAEALWVLAWALGKYPTFDLLQRAPDDLVRHFPDLKKKEPADSWKASASLIDAGELDQWLDLAYCLHWSIRERSMRGDSSLQIGSIHAQSVVERRRALEWLCNEGDWDKAALDT